MTHFIIFEGQLQAPDDIYLSGERNLPLKVNGGHTSALLTLIYVVCNIEYPEECRHSYSFVPERSFEWTMLIYRLRYYSS